MWGRWLACALLLGCAGTQTDSDPSESDTASTGTLDTQTAPLADSCLGEAFPRSFDTGKGGVLFGDLAQDFTVNTLDGTAWTLSENWTGCDSYVFITYFEGSEGDALWGSSVADLLPAAPRNVHFFFVSEENGPARRENRVRTIQEAMNLGPAQSQRVHFVTDKLSGIAGSVGAMASDFLAYRPDSAVDLGERGQPLAPRPSFLGIDREQRWDSGGNVFDVVGGNPEIQMAAYLPLFYNHKADLAHRLSSEEATEVVLLDDAVTDRVFIVEAEVPADLSAFDTFEFDVGVFCPARNVFACSEWDRNARIELCVDGKACADRRELVRWITPYWRRGGRRWAIDASPLLALLQGGQTHFRVEMGPSWERATERQTRIVARFSNRGSEPSSGVERAYQGGSFNADYNANHMPFSFSPPANASKVELMVILSGHGQAEITNCAEWCDHRHTFAVNGTELPVVRPEGQIGSRAGCAPQAAQGVPPGQYGNWAPLRAYWCPGLPVAPIRFDITKEIALGKANELTYSASLGSSNPPGGGNIDLSVYLVWYE